MRDLHILDWYCRACISTITKINNNNNQHIMLKTYCFYFMNYSIKNCIAISNNSLYF